MIKEIFKNRVFQNFSYLTIGTIISQLIGILVVLKISRIFTTIDYGSYTFILAQAQLISTIGDLGMRNIIIRAISIDKTRTKDLIYNGIKLRFLATSILFILYMVYNGFLGSLNNELILLLFLFALSGIIGNLFESAFIGNQKMFIPATYNLGFSILLALIIFNIPLEYCTVNVLLAIYIGTNVVKDIILYYIMLKNRILIGNVNNFDKSFRQILKESWPYFILILVMLPVISLSNNFLDLNSTKTEIAYFNISQKLIGPLTMVIGFATSSLFPNLSALWVNDEKRFKYLTSQGFHFFILLALCPCFCFTIFSKEIVVILFSAKYQGAIEVCQLQIWYVLLFSVNSLIGMIFGAIQNDKQILKSGIVNSIISTPLLFWGSKYGALGLSYAYVISFAIFEIYLWNEFKKVVKTKTSSDLRIWGLVLISFLISYSLHNNIQLYIRIIIALLYMIGISLFLLKSEKIQLFRKIT
jgi:O-antigen/teichoic acid export membrane protein